MFGRPGGDAQRADEFLVEHLHQRVGIGLARAAGGVDLTIGRLGVAPDPARIRPHRDQSRSEEHTSELQSLMRISYAVFCLKKKNQSYIFIPQYYCASFIIT